MEKFTFVHVERLQTLVLFTDHSPNAWRRLPKVLTHLSVWLQEGKENEVFFTSKK